MSHPISGPRHLHQLAESPTCPDPCLNGDSMTQPRGRGGAPSASGWCPLLQQASAWQLRERPRHSRQQWSPVQEGAARSHLVLLPATNIERKLAQCLCRSGKRCLFFFFPGLTGSPRGLDKLNCQSNTSNTSCITSQALHESFTSANIPRTQNGCSFDRWGN